MRYTPGAISTCPLSRPPKGLPAKTKSKRVNGFLPSVTQRFFSQNTTRESHTEIFDKPCFGKNAFDQLALKLYLAKAACCGKENVECNFVTITEFLTSFRIADLHFLSFLNVIVFVPRNNRKRHPGLMARSHQRTFLWTEQSALTTTKKEKQRNEALSCFDLLLVSYPYRSWMIKQLDSKTVCVNRAVDEHAFSFQYWVSSKFSDLAWTAKSSQVWKAQSFFEALC